MTTTWALLGEKRAEIPGSLRRQFWLPLRRLLKMFHLLPIAAAALLFGLLAFEGQLSEIYVSYLEDIGSAGVAVTVIRFVAAAAGFALISAVLYEAHYRLSGPRINVIYSMNSEVGTASRLRHVQDVAAILIALSPWLGLVAGLAGAKASLTSLFATLQQANVDPATLQHVPSPSAGAIVAGLMVLGVVMAYLAAANPKNQTLQRAVMLLSPLAAGSMLLLLNGAPALPATASQIGATVISIAALVAYYVVYYRIQMLRAYIFQAKALQEDNNFSMRQWQRIMLFVWALLPWVLVLAIYFLLPTIFAIASRPTGADVTGLKSVPLPSLAMMPVAMCWVIAIGLLVASWLHKVRDRGTAKIWLYGIVCFLAGLGLLVFWLASPDQIVTACRLLGPLSSLAFSLLFLISIFVLLAVLSQRSAFPALTSAILILVLSAILPMSPGWSTGLLCLMCVAVAAMAILSRLFSAATLAVLLIAIVQINYFKSEENSLKSYQQANGAALTQQFNNWLTGKGVPASGGTAAAVSDSCFAAPTQATPSGLRYPVFIVAVEGGGIYAASAASTFLARLQDDNPCFSDHVFAVSAVSGGAIGSAIFQAVEKARLDKAPSPGTSPSDAARIANAAGTSPPGQANSDKCQPPALMGQAANAGVSLQREVCDIIEGDNFSPLVASIFPELLGFNKKGRAAELAASFQQSANSEDAGAGKILSAPFSTDWSDSSKAPAMVLNATWVETGFRVALAPFPLHKIDDSLYSFVDACMPIDSTQTLIQAAAVSARFPFILPPYSVEVTPPAGSKDCGTEKSRDPQPVHWNFVDGGYSDSSGAATALAIYRALSGVAQSRKVALHLILLTSSDPQLEASQITGTTFADVMGPLDAILSVRAGLANEAVARACDGVAPPAQSGAGASALQNTCEDRANTPDSPLQIVGIEDQTYGLSLGWKISQTTFSVVSWMLGQPDDVGDADCKGSANAPEANAQSNGRVVLNEAIVRRNSCVQRSIEQSLGTATH